MKIKMLKGGTMGGFLLALLLIAIGIAIGVISVTFTCSATNQHGISAFWTFVTTVGKGCGI